MKRMARAKRNRMGALNLTSLMDVFTILVLYLLVNQSSVEVAEPPKDIKLPDSVVEAKPRQTVIMMVSERQILIQGEPVATYDEVLNSQGGIVEPIRASLQKLRGNVIGLNTAAIAKGNEITIMAHRTVPFKVLKTLMSSCTSAGYASISLAVNQKSTQN
ncbi:MAG: biopolymer transporter ExbD [Gammaproteobacteria bacterium]|nr:biopolymer transporter ExbD [Gammaproteobacteria bacterium]MBU1481522.1 biopolymer transporter ExbD [Gammaproteobacteria bacterium]